VTGVEESVTNPAAARYIYVSQVGDRVAGPCNPRYRADTALAEPKIQLSDRKK
jgi:hypothetical protein